MKLKLNSGICRIVDVGMYESFIDPRYLFESDYYEIDKSEVLTKEEKEYFYEKDSDCFNHQKYDDVVMKYGLEIVGSFFTEIKDTIKVTLLDTWAAISSPAYYNFTSDKLNFDVEIEQAEFDKILLAVTDDKRFWKWAEQYKSCSGFISFMPWYKDDYIEAIQGHDIERAVSMYLTYLYEKDLPECNEFETNYQLAELIGNNYSAIDFIDDERAQEIYGKAILNL